MAKGSLYYNFGGKDELVRTYLNHRHTRWAARIGHYQANAETPEQKILAIFDALADLFAEPDFRGCAFINAAAEAPPASTEALATKDFRTWLHELFTLLVAAAGYQNVPTLSLQLVLLCDGSNIAAQLDARPEAAQAARRELSSKLHLRRPINGERPSKTVLRLTKALAGLAAQTVIQAQAVLRNARRTAVSSTGKVAGPLRRAVRQLAATIDRTHRIVGQTQARLAGDMPPSATRIVSVHDPDVRPIAKAGLTSRSSSATRRKWSTTPTASSSITRWSREIPTTPPCWRRDRPDQSAHR